MNSKREFLPSFDLESQLPKDIYDINSIISEEDWDLMTVEPFIVALKKK